MKKYGKLIIAFMWLGLTMIMIVGATFAWFSENRNVEANGMSVQAETSSNLLITNKDKSVYNYTASAKNSATTELSPASTSGSVLGSGSFFYADRTHITYSTGAATDDTVFTAVAAANIASDAAVSSGKTYVSKNTFYITAVGDTSKKFDNVYVSSISVTHSNGTPAQNISSSLRVAVVCTNGSTTYAYIFEPVSGATASYQGIKAAGTGLTSTTLASDNETITTCGTSATLGELNIGATEGAEYLEVFVYVWYEGQDLNCTSANSVNVEDLLVKVSFQCPNDPVAK